MNVAPSHGVGASVLIGASGGLCLGAAARWWMRAIAEDPEFTWNGTLAILIGFTFFGLGQSIASIVRRRARRPWVHLGRIVGIVTMLPLFLAAGGPMVPTVIGGGLAVAHPNWRPAVRAVLVGVACLPVLFITWDIAHTFGGSLQTVIGIVGLVAIYATIIWATRFSFAPHAPGCGRQPRASY